jgi:hypothetical protein
MPILYDPDDQTTPFDNSGTGTAGTTLTAETLLDPTVSQGVPDTSGQPTGSKKIDPANDKYSGYGKDYQAYKAQGGTSNPEKFYNGTALPPGGSSPAIGDPQTAVQPGSMFDIGKVDTTAGPIGQYDTSIDKVGQTNLGPIYQGDSEGIREDVARDVSGIGPTTREVQDEELVKNQLSGLLNSDSKYMQDARRQGLEQANAMGGLGGTAGIGASMTAALRAGLPIAMEDARAFKQAASENMDALNKFAQLNLQRETQLELGHLDAATRTDITKMTNSLQAAVSKMQTNAQIDIANLDAQTKMNVTAMQGQIQERLANLAFKHNALLQDQQIAGNLALADVQGQYDLQGRQITGEYQMGQTQIAGEYNLETQAMQNEAAREGNYMTQVLDIQANYYNMLNSGNGIEMDDAARARIVDQANNYYNDSIDYLSILYPDMEPIRLKPREK